MVERLGVLADSINHLDGCVVDNLLEFGLSSAQAHLLKTVGECHEFEYFYDRLKQHFIIKRFKSDK